MMPIKHTISFSGHKEEWDNFRLICKLQDKNASKELRKYINDYILKHLELLEDFNEQQLKLKEMFINGELD